MHPPVHPNLTDYNDESRVREKLRQQSELNSWLSMNLTSVGLRVDKLEGAVAASHEVISDLQEKLETLLSAIREEVSVIAAHAPKTLAAAGRIAMEDIKDEQP